MFVIVVMLITSYSTKKLVVLTINIMTQIKMSVDGAHNLVFLVILDLTLSCVLLVCQEWYSKTEKDQVNVFMEEKQEQFLVPKNMSWLVIRNVCMPYNSTIVKKPNQQESNITTLMMLISNGQNVIQLLKSVLILMVSLQLMIHQFT